MRVSHRACPACGRYNGKVVIDFAQKAQARAARKEAKVKAAKQ
jgi:hypothetical protein